MTALGRKKEKKPWKTALPLAGFEPPISVSWAKCSICWAKAPCPFSALLKVKSAVHHARVFLSYTASEFKFSALGLILGINKIYSYAANIYRWRLVDANVQRLSSAHKIYLITDRAM